MKSLKSECFINYKNYYKIIYTNIPTINLYINQYFRFTVSYDVDMAATKSVSETDDSIKKIKLYFCSKCPASKTYDKPYKTANGLNTHEEKKTLLQKVNLFLRNLINF